MTDDMTLGATQVRLYPGDTLRPIALGEQSAKLITNRRRTGEERTPAYALSRAEWRDLVQHHPSRNPPQEQVQAYRVGQARDVLYPKILMPAALENVHTFIVALGTMATSRSHRETVDLLELDYDNDLDVFWSTVIVPTEWYETATGANLRAEYESTNTRGSSQ